MSVARWASDAEAATTAAVGTRGEAAARWPRRKEPPGGDESARFIVLDGVSDAAK